jgi:hypothetical protein
VAIDELCPAPPLLTSSPPSIADRWVWQINPSLRGKDGYEPRNVQKECERLELEGKLSPAIQQKSVEAIVEELRRAGVKTSPSTVRRAFGSSKDRYRS